MMSAGREMSRTRLYLCVSSWIAASLMFASVDANAFACLPSAEAVKQQDPAAWPSWTLRAPGFEGKKCWYSSTRGAAHEHRSPPTPDRALAITTPSRAPAISEPREPEPEVTGSATEFERPRTSMSERPRTSMSELDSTFEDRFSAVCPIAGRPVPGCVSRQRN
jgi:hypothetical protein